MRRPVCVAGGFKMRAGFDYGTSHCSLGVWRDDAVHLLPVEDDRTLIASTLYAPRPQLNLQRGQDEVLNVAAGSFAELRFGQRALDAYLTDPTQGYFVKSPKSFLGAPGLTAAVKERFVAVVAAMMANVREHGVAACGQPIDQVVIGRPVNFQSAGGNAENSQAVQMLTDAAHQAGFTDVAFLFEPMAAAMEYEARLAQERCVLVVDIGGGTTDCSFVRVGPGRRENVERDSDILGHAGERLGGNDYDQRLALAAVMPGLGFGDELNNGLPIPNHYFVDAVSTNDVNAQQRFYAADTAERLRYFVREACVPERVTRFARVREQRSSYRLLQQVESAKIALSSASGAEVGLEFLDAGYTVATQEEQFRESAARLLEHLSGLINEVMRQADVTPDVIYLTGGMARATVVREHLAEVVGSVPQIDSDHFASVTEGLTLWSQRVFDA